MISRYYTLVINKREYQVDFKTHACHTTRTLKRLQHNEFYDDFVDNFRFETYEDLKNYFIMYMGRYISIKPLMESESNRPLFDACMSSVILAAWFCETFKNWQGKITDYVYQSDFLMYDSMLNENINYIEGFSPAYQSIDVLLPVYHNLVYGIEDDMPVMRKIITPEQINICLADLGHTVRCEDIEQDIIKHYLLRKEGDHFVWVDPFLRKILYNSDTAHLHGLSLQKLLGRNNYNYYV